MLSASQKSTELTSPKGVMIPAVESPNRGSHATIARMAEKSWLNPEDNRQVLAPHFAEVNT